MIDEILLNGLSSTLLSLTVPHHTKSFSGLYQELLALYECIAEWLEQSLSDYETWV